MKMETVDSEAIHSVGYDPATSTMRIRWHSGGTYDYPGVSPAKHQALLQAGSIGRHFHKHIRPHHPGSKV